MLKLKTHSGFHDLFLKYSIIQLYCNMNGNNSVLRKVLVLYYHPFVSEVDGCHRHHHCHFTF